MPEQHTTESQEKLNDFTESCNKLLGYSYNNADESAKRFIDYVFDNEVKSDLFLIYFLSILPVVSKKYGLWYFKEVLKNDINRFFDTQSKTWLKIYYYHRIYTPKNRRLIQKVLNTFIKVSNDFKVYHNNSQKVLERWKNGIPISEKKGSHKTTRILSIDESMLRSLANTLFIESLGREMLKFQETRIFWNQVLPILKKSEGEFKLMADTSLYQKLPNSFSGNTSSNEFIKINQNSFFHDAIAALYESKNNVARNLFKEYNFDGFDFEQVVETIKKANDEFLEYKKEKILDPSTIKLSRPLNRYIHTFLFEFFQEMASFRKKDDWKSWKKLTNQVYSDNAWEQYKIREGKKLLKKTIF